MSKKLNVLITIVFYFRATAEEMKLNENRNDEFPMITQTEGIRLRTLLKKKNEIIDGLKKSLERRQIPEEIRLLPKGLEYQDSAKQNVTSRKKKSYCDEPSCEECEHITDPDRHFAEKISPIIEKCNGDIDTVCSISVSESEIRVPRELDMNPAMFRRFQECHCCLFYWRDKQHFRTLVNGMIIQRNLYKSYNAKTVKRKR